MKQLIISIFIFSFIMISCKEKKEINLKQKEKDIELPLNLQNKELIFYLVSENKAVDSIEFRDIKYVSKGINKFGHDYIKINFENFSSYWQVCEAFENIEVHCFNFQEKVFVAKHHNYRSSDIPYNVVEFAFSNSPKNSSEGVGNAEVNPGDHSAHKQIAFDAPIKDLSIVFYYNYSSFKKRKDAGMSLSIPGRNKYHEKIEIPIDSTVLLKVERSPIVDIFKKHGLMD